MNLDDVAERLGKSKRTVMRWVDEGRVPKPVIRNGRLIVWSSGVMERFFRRHRHKLGDNDHGRPRREPSLTRKRMAKSARGDAGKKHGRR